MTRKYLSSSYIMHYCIFCHGLMVSNFNRNKLLSKIVHTECRLLLQNKIMRVRNRATSI